MAGEAVVGAVASDGAVAAATVMVDAACTRDAEATAELAPAGFTPVAIVAA
jgi:alkylhydroperoxidase family enzyme